MGTKAFLQKGRTKPGVVLPANAVARVNQANDRSALVREHEKRQAMEQHAADPLPNIGTSIAAKARESNEAFGKIGCGSYAKLSVTPAEEPREAEPVVELEEPEAAISAVAAVATGAAPDVVRAAEPVVESEDAVEAGEDAALTTISGIGEKLAARFAMYGYVTLVDLAKADAETINEIPGVRNRGRQWVDEARVKTGLK